MGLARLAGLWVVLLGLVLAGPARAADGAEVHFPRSHVEVVTRAGRRIGLDVELAVTPDQLRHGLMFRRSLPADAGMLFDFGRVEPVEMWMKNTLIPLDMVFIAGDGRVVGVARRTVPQSLDIISSPRPVRAVLEINAGAAARLGIRRGDRVVAPIFAK